MAVYLGIDTGGTFTDAVIFDPDRGMLASAKSLTTRHDLSLGVAGALRELGKALTPTPRIDLVCLSSTLATNAIVEGQLQPMCQSLPDAERRETEDPLPEAVANIASGTLAFDDSGGQARTPPVSSVDALRATRICEKGGGRRQGGEGCKPAIDQQAHELKT